MTEETAIHKRRPRYRGTHPRKFDEKYKELNPEKYAGDVAKVLSRGQTPAGTHRPICVDEILTALAPKPGEIGIDATLGFGGHTSTILPKLIPGGRLYGIDVDPIELPRTENRLRALGFSEEVLVVRRMNFAGLPQLLADVPEGFDFVLADLGVSSMQIDTPSRGFSFKSVGPLDLRLNPNRGLSAAEFLKTQTVESLAEVLRLNSDEPHAVRIARAICNREGTIATTVDLATVIRAALSFLPKETRAEETKKSLQRSFQALRIAVNNEFGVLDQFLNLLPNCLKPGGRVAILTFHSGEDRRVKQAFQDGLEAGIYASVSPTPIRPSPAERRDNPRSSCAKLRWAVRN
jgi:16S rRNA (cytosine1402-N4)-methyltransferase